MGIKMQVVARSLIVFNFSIALHVQVAVHVWNFNISIVKVLCYVVHKVLISRTPSTLCTILFTMYLKEKKVKRKVSNNDLELYIDHGLTLQVLFLLLYMINWYTVCYYVMLCVNSHLSHPISTVYDLVYHDLKRKERQKKSIQQWSSVVHRPWSYFTRFFFCCSSWYAGIGL